MKKIQLLSIWLLPLVIALGCSKHQAMVSIKVLAKTPDGTPVSEAKVALDGETIGHTNAFGTYSGDFRNVSSGKFHKIEVTKDDNGYYFAPHIDLFHLKSGESRNLNVKAEMYLVPKPKSKLKTKSAVASSNASSVNQSTANNLKQNLDFSTIPLLEIEETSEAEKIQKEESLPSQFNVHIYSGRIPVERALVQWFNNGIKTSSCETNERGRCILHFKKNESHQGSLLVKKNLFRSALLNLIPHENENVRLTLEPGASSTFQVQSVSVFGTKPLESVVIKHGKEILGTSNVDGLVVIPELSDNNKSLFAETKNERQDVQLSATDHTSDLQKINFPNTDVLSWKTWSVSPLLVEKKIPNSRDQFLGSFKIAENILANLPGGTLEERPLPTLSQDVAKVLIVPILKQGNDRESLQLVAVQDEKVIGQSDEFSFDVSPVSQNRSSVYKTMVENLKERMPWPAIVTGVEGRKVQLMMESNFVKPGDKIELSTEPSPQILSVTKTVNSSEVIGEISEGSKKEKFNKSIFEGAIGHKVVPSLSAKYFSASDRSAYRIIKKNSTYIQLAQKYLEEFNPDGALKVLNDVHASELSDRSVWLMRIKVHQFMRDYSALIQDFNLEMHNAVEKNQTQLALIAESNLLILKALAAPVLRDETSLSEYLDELSTRMQGVLESLPKNSLASTLPIQYAALVASRKKAQIDGDDLALTTLNSQLDQLESNLSTRQLETQVEKEWRSRLAVEREHIQIKSSSDHQSM